MALRLESLDADADLYIDDSEGDPLYGSFNTGEGDETINAHLWDGTFTLRVEAQERSRNDFILRMETLATSADDVPLPEEVDTSGLDTGPDTVPANANDLGDISDQLDAVTVEWGVNDGSDHTDLNRFSITDTRNATVTPQNLSPDAHLYLENEHGDTIGSSAKSRRGNECVNKPELAAGTHYIRVKSQATGDVTYGASLQRRSPARPGPV